MKKFEYRLLESESSLFSGFDYKELHGQLNTLGRQGWEVITVTALAVGAGQTNSLLVTLKRELPE